MRVTTGGWLVTPRMNRVSMWLGEPCIIALDTRRRAIGFRGGIEPRLAAGRAEIIAHFLMVASKGRVRRRYHHAADRITNAVSARRRVAVRAPTGRRAFARRSSFVIPVGHWRFP
jgi:hypothetical protein